MTIGVGLIGCGFIGRFHGKNIRDLARRGANAGALDIDYHAVCDRDLDRAQTFAQLGGCTLVTTDAAALIASPAVSAVYICTETAEHVDLAIAAASAGKHVFCEKPLATNFADAKRMFDAVTAAGVVHQVGLVLRFSPVFRVLQDLMQQEDLGPLLSVQLRDDQFFPVRGHYGSAWRGDVERAGGGALIEHSIHDIDLITRLAGDVARVRCHTRYTSGHRGVEDVASVTFEHVAGHTSQICSIWHAMDGRASSRRIEIFFEGGYLATEHDYFGSLTYQRRRGDPITIGAEEVLDRYLRLEGLEPMDHDLQSIGGICDRAFLEAVAQGHPARPDFGDALAAHRLVDACYVSAREQREVTPQQIDERSS